MKECFKEVEGMLHSYRMLNVEIKDLALEIEELVDSEYDGIVGHHHQIGPGSATNKIISTVESQVMQKERELERLNRLKRKKERRIKRIENMITILREDQQQFIRLKYFEGRKNKDIANIMLLSEDGINSKRKTTINELCRFVENQKIINSISRS